MANQSLVLQNASRARTGIYTCVGSNREGDGESNPVQLDIRCEYTYSTIDKDILNASNDLLHLLSVN